MSLMDSNSVQVELFLTENILSVFYAESFYS